MATTLEERIFTSLTEVLDYLKSIGFTVNNNKILWSKAESDTQCYLYLKDDKINFKRSDGTDAFTKTLVDFNYSETEEDEEGEEIVTYRTKCAVMSLPLQNNGIILYLGMLTQDTKIGDITLCCANADPVQNNGLIVYSPAEDDGHWYHGWNHPGDSDDVFYWCMDNGHGNYEYGDAVTQIPPKKIIESDLSLTLVKTYLNTGHWSKNFRVQVTGNLTAPGSIFQINGQKFITLTNNSVYRAPAYKLPPESTEQNLTTSTEIYSATKTYLAGDYCIYNDSLYKCIMTITTPEPFDLTKWQITTVYNEMIEYQNSIYGD